MDMEDMKPCQRMKYDDQYIIINDTKRARPPYVPYLCSIRCTLDTFQLNTVYQYCTCGRTQHTNKILCDNTCEQNKYQYPQSKQFKALPFTITKEQRAYNICGCRYVVLYNNHIIYYKQNIVIQLIIDIYNTSL